MFILKVFDNKQLPENSEEKVSFELEEFGLKSVKQLVIRPDATLGEIPTLRFDVIGCVKGKQYCMIDFYFYD